MPDPFSITVDDVTIRGERAGSGPPVLLLHGIPETRRMWRHVAPGLAATSTVVSTDLRGYGESDAAAGVADHSMRSLAREQVAVMRELGYERFAVVGHDRGARCAYRMASDFPDDPRVFDDALRDHYTATFRDPDRVHAVCEQYRAAATADVRHDEADLGRNPIRCPTLVLWSATGAVAAWYEPLAIWRRWGDDVRGRALDCGHFLPEEAPDAVTSELLSFLA